MPGQSQQEKEAKRQLDQQKTFQGDLQAGKYDAANRFDNYSDPFGYNDISSQLDKIFCGQEDILKRNTADQIAQQQQKAGASLASRGITGGSALTDTQSEIANGLNKSQSNALGQLGIGKASAMDNLMRYENQNKFNQTNAAENVDMGNKRNILGGLQNSYGQSQNLLGGLDSGTWLDDLFAGLSTAAQIASIPITGGATAPGAASSLLGMLF